MMDFNKKKTQSLFYDFVNCCKLLSSQWNKGAHVRHFLHQFGYKIEHQSKRKRLVSLKAVSVDLNEIENMKCSQTEKKKPEFVFLFWLCLPIIMTKPIQRVMTIIVSKINDIQREKKEEGKKPIFVLTKEDANGATETKVSLWASLTTIIKFEYQWRQWFVMPGFRFWNQWHHQNGQFDMRERERSEAFNWSLWSIIFMNFAHAITIIIAARPENIESKANQQHYEIPKFKESIMRCIHVQTTSCGSHILRAYVFTKCWLIIKKRMVKRTWRQNTQICARPFFVRLCWLLQRFFNKIEFNFGFLWLFLPFFRLFLEPAHCIHFGELSKCQMLNGAFMVCIELSMLFNALKKCQNLPIINAASILWASISIANFAHGIDSIRIYHNLLHLSSGIYNKFISFWGRGRLSPNLSSHKNIHFLITRRIYRISKKKSK